jgi:hypothetical protein
MMTRENLGDDWVIEPVKILPPSLRELYLGNNMIGDDG